MMFIEKKIINIDGVKWYLDSPKENHVDDDGFEIRGWLITKLDLALFIKIDDKSLEALSWNCERSDVKRHFNITDGQVNICGFRHTIKFNNSMELFLFDKKLSEQKIILIINKKEVIKVLFGTDGFLFLDNDTNYSVEQFRGMFKIPDGLFEEWNTYLHKLKMYSKKYNFVYDFVVAPSKEEIYQSNYPYERGSNVFIDQFMNLFGDVINYPINELVVNKDFSYNRTDTHWSDFGAYIASSEVLKRFGLLNLVSLLENSFMVCNDVGDLGDKLLPHLSSNCLNLSNRMEMNFNNQISNVGKVWIFETVDNFKQNSSIVIFGDSFSNNMVQFFAKLFRRVVFVHSVASIDIDILEYEKPDYVIFQINQRFLINCPSEISIWDKIKQKVNKMSKSEVINAINMINGYEFSKYEFYINNMLFILKGKLIR